LDRLVQTFPEDDSALMALAWAYYDGGELDQAIGSLEELFARELKRPIFTGFAYDELVRLYRETKQYDRLIEICLKAYEAYPEEKELGRELGIAYLRGGKTKEAIDLFGQLIKQEPTDASIYCLLGEALIKEGKFTQADRVFTIAANSEPEAAATFYRRLATLYLEIGENHRAEEALRKSLTVDERNPLSYILLGDSLIPQGKLREAHEAYKKAISLSPSSASAIYHRWGMTLLSSLYLAEAEKVLAMADTSILP